MKEKITMCKIDELKEYSNNARNNREAVKYVRESIEKFGFIVPIIIDKNNVIVAGHTRKKAAEDLNMTELPCIVIDNLTDSQIKAFRLVDNKTAEYSTWDFEKLKNELAEIDIDISMFEFPNLENIELDISDDDFLKDTEIVRDRKKKTIICPACGEEFEI